MLLFPLNEEYSISYGFISFCFVFRQDELFVYFTTLRFALYGSFMFAFIVFLFASLQRTEVLIERMTLTTPRGRQFRRTKRLNRFLYAVKLS
jgi:hypothetical protein